MSARRRFKPAVNLAPRRAATTVANSSSSSSNSSSPTPSATSITASAAAAHVPASAPDAKPTPADDVPPTVTDEPSHAATTATPPHPTPVTANLTQQQQDVAAEADALLPATTPTVSSPATPDDAIAAEPPTPTQPAVKLPARRIKPAVCLPVRKRKAPSTAAASESPPSSDQLNETITASEMAPNADNFKAPFIAPENTDAPPTAEAGADPDDMSGNVKNPMSPAKSMRPRMRPTPCLGQRRNSLQGGNESEPTSDAEPPKRPRHISIGSGGVGHTPAANDSEASIAASTQSVQNGHGKHQTRVRTESDSSSSDAAATHSDASTHPSSARSSQAPPIITLPPISHKPKKSTQRSDETLRIAQAKRDFHQRFNGQQPDKARLTMFDMIFYNPTTNPMKNPAVKSPGIRSRRNSNASSVSEAASVARSAISRCSTGGRSGSGAAGAGSTKGSSVGGGGSVVRRTSTESNESLVSRSSSSNVSSGAASSVKREPEPKVSELMPVPQLKLGPNGEIVLDEKSLLIETTGDKEARATLANAEIVYDDEFSGTSGFYKRNKRTRDWPADETIRFYRCLHTIGTDFSLMLMLFPNRSRRDLKLKFKKEERINPGLINKALLHPNLFDIDELKRDFEREQADLDRMRAECEEQARRKREDKKAYTKNVMSRRSATKSSAERILADGDGLYELADADAVAMPPAKRVRKPRQLPQIVHDVIIKSAKGAAIEVVEAMPAAFPVNGTYTNTSSTTNNSTITTSTSTTLPQPAQTPSQTQPLPYPISLLRSDTPLHRTEDLFSDFFVEPATTTLTTPTAGADDNDDDDDDDEVTADILNMEIIFEPYADAVSPENRYIIRLDEKSAQQSQPTETTEDMPWSVDDVMVSDEPALPEIAKIAHNNVVLYDVTASPPPPPPPQAEASDSDMDLEVECSAAVDATLANTQQDAPKPDIKPRALAVSPAFHAIASPAIVAATDDLHLYDDCGINDERVRNSIKAEPSGQRNRVIEVKPAEAKCDGAGVAPAATVTMAVVNEDAEGDGGVNDDNDNNDDDDDDDDDDEDDDDDDDDMDFDSLVVVARQDADGNVVHEVFHLSPTTGQLSEEPLDLPAEVIERIKEGLVAA